MSGIILLMNLDFSGSIGYHLTSIHKNTPQTNPRCIIIDSVLLTTLRQSKHRGWSESVFELLETLLTSLRLFKPGFLLRQSCMWGINGRKAFHKPTVVTSQSQKAKDVSGSKGLWPVLNIFSLPGVHLYTLVGHNMTHEGHWSQPVFTLGEFGIQLIPSKYLQG